MKDKGLILVLLLVAVGLGIAVIVIRKQATDKEKDAADSIAAYSNKVTSITRQRDELQTVNQTLETNLAAARADSSNKLALADASLRTAEANLEKTTAEAKAQAKAVADSNAVTLAQRDQKISDLEMQNQVLDKEAASLRTSITNLEGKITATQEKLAKSEGDRDFLLKELKLLIAAKADMEKKFNTIADVREQLHKLKVEASLARQLDMMRRGIYASFHERGGERMIHPPAVIPSEPGPGTSVELREGGGVKIQTVPSTNAPPK